jgi:hypothetical protein
MKSYNVSDEKNENFNRILHGFFFEDITTAPHESYYGNYQLLLEKRMIYISRSRLFFIIHTLFPFIMLSDSSFYNKTKLLKDPEC